MEVAFILSAKRLSPYCALSAVPGFGDANKTTMPAHVGHTLYVAGTG